MTTFVEITKKCYACNKASIHKEISSTNAFGSPDLDTRPPEMERSTIDMWIQMCPSCGYSSADISEGYEKVLDVINTNSYQEQFKSPEYPKLANAFLCFSLIQENNCEYSEAGWSSVHAAWACDDADYEISAQKCRMRAISLFRKAKESNQKFAEPDGVEEVIIVDLLRRSCHFELAFSICEEVLKKKQERIISNIMKLQKMLINNKDVACHLIADVRKVPIEVEPIIEELKDEDYNVRRNAVKELGKIGNAKAVEPLIEELKDKYYNIRMNAAEALGRIRDTKAVEPLIEALKDEDNIFLNIQWKAAEALGEIGGERATELLIQVLNDENKDVREGAAYALRKIEDAKTVDSIIHALKDENKDTRMRAAVDLGNIRTARAVEPLIHVLKDENRDTRIRAAMALGNIRDARAVKPLIHVLKDENKDVREGAAWALGEIGDARAIEFLVQALSDENIEVQRRAAEALRKIED